MLTGENGGSVMLFSILYCTTGGTKSRVGSIERREMGWGEWVCLIELKGKGGSDVVWRI